jgi:hypothetical protein
MGPFSRSLAINQFHSKGNAGCEHCHMNYAKFFSKTTKSHEEDTAFTIMVMNNLHA